MMSEDVDVTRQVYEDPEIVRGYIEKNNTDPELYQEIDAFAKELEPGSAVLDLGCGPGHETYHWQELGFATTGLDYSGEMIAAAKKFHQMDNPPTFQQGDMRKLVKSEENPNGFPKKSFDVIWTRKSLLHIPEEETSQVLSQMRQILKDTGKVYIELKAGPQGTRMIQEDKYGKPMERQFTFWEKDKFAQLAEKAGFSIEKVHESINIKNLTANKPTNWMGFYLTKKHE